VAVPEVVAVSAQVVEAILMLSINKLLPQSEILLKAKVTLLCPFSEAKLIDLFTHCIPVGVKAVLIPVAVAKLAPPL
jgi:hypothetical protein